MAAPQIVGGAVPYTARNATSTGYLTANQGLTSALGFAGTSGTPASSFSLGGGTVTVGVDPDDASAVVVTASPKTAGAFTFTIRISNANGSSDYTTNLFCYNPGGDGFLTLLPDTFNGLQLVGRSDGWFYLITAVASSTTFGSLTLAANRRHVICCNEAGVAQWSASVGSYSSFGSETLFTLDANNNLYWAVDLASGTATYYNSGGTTAFTQAGATNRVTLTKLSATGTWQWIKTLDGFAAADLRASGFAAGSSYGYFSFGLASTRTVTLGGLSLGTVAAGVARCDLGTGNFTTTLTSSTNTGFTYIRAAVTPDDKGVFQVGRASGSGSLTIGADSAAVGVGSTLLVTSAAGLLMAVVVVSPTISGTTGTGRIVPVLLTANSSEILGMMRTDSSGSYTFNTNPNTGFTASSVDTVVWSLDISKITTGYIDRASRSTGSGNEAVSAASKYGSTTIFGDTIAATKQVAFGSFNYTAPANDAAFVSCWDGSQFTWLEWAYASGRNVSQPVIGLATARNLGPNGLLGGAVVALAMNTGSATNMYFSNGGASVVVPTTSVLSRYVLTTISSSGQWQKTDAVVTTPKGGDGSTSYSPPDAPVIEGWPATMVEEQAIFSKTATGYDPEYKATELQIYALQVWNAATGAWVGAETGPVSINYSGKGTLTVTPSPSGDMNASLTFTPNTNWYGKLTVIARWTSLGSFGYRVGPAAKFVTTYLNDPEPPTTPAGAMPNADEDTYSQATWTTTDPDHTGSYTWQLSPQTSKPDGWPNNVDFHTVTGSSVSITVNGITAGTAAIVSQNNSNRNAQVRFTPAANWHGSASFDLRVSNGNGWSAWTTANVQIEAVPDAPSALTPALIVDINEDEFATHVVTWQDPDTTLSPIGNSYAMQFALDIPSYTWVDIEENAPFDQGDVLFTLLSLNSDTRTASIRVEPKANWYGTYTLKARVVDNSDTPTLYGAASVLSGTIVSVADTPSRVTPSVMPRTKPGRPVSQTFFTVDPDPEDGSWVFSIAASAAGTYGSTVTIANMGTVTVENVVTSDKQATVTMTPALSAYGKYEFWIVATDPTGRTSTPTKVTGYVTGTQLGAFLQRVQRTSTGASVSLLCPVVSLLDLEMTDALNGPGSARMTVSSQEMQRRAKALGMTVADLLSPSSTELVLLLGAQPIWVGPVSGHSYDPTGDGTITVTATGLLGYFEARNVTTTSPSALATFTNVDQSSIVWSLLNASQGEQYGGLSLTDGTVPCGTNSTVSWAGTTTISEALRDLARLAGSAEVWIDMERNVRAAATRGQDRRNRVRITDGMVTDLMRDVNWDSLVTVGVVVGADTATPGLKFEGVHEDAAAMAKYGRVVKVVEAPQLVSNASCAALAREIVLRNSAPVESFSIELDMNPYRQFNLTDLEVGDVVTLDIDDPLLGRILRDVRIVNRQVSLVSEASDSFVVSLDVETAVWVDGVLQGSRSRHVAELYDQVTEVMYASRTA